MIKGGGFFFFPKLEIVYLCQSGAIGWSNAEGGTKAFCLSECGVVLFLGG